MKNNKRIVTERTLEIGEAKLQEGDKAFIRFCELTQKKHRTPFGSASDCWMLAKLYELKDRTAKFRTSKHEILLYPEDILDVADKCPLEDATHLSKGYFMPAQIERSIHNVKQK